MRVRSVLVFMVVASVVLSGATAIRMLGCGKTSSHLQSPLEERVVNGSEAKPGQFPHQVRMEYYNAVEGSWNFFCGATIMDSHNILTAAHCLDGVERPEFVRIFVGAHDSNGGERYDIGAIVMHKNFNTYTYQNDIAMMRTTNRIRFKLTRSGKDNVNRVCLPSGRMNYKSGDRFIATGWGLTETNGTTPERTLRKVSLLNMPESQECRSRGELREYFICAGSFNFGGVCQGDSGGPLVRLVGDAYELVGITSHMGPDDEYDFCRKEGQDDFFTRVDIHLDWIKAAKIALAKDSPVGTINILRI